MKAHVTLIVAALTLAGCASAAPTSHAPSARGSVEQAHAPGEVTPLAAGLYFRDGFYERDACEGCAEPTAALIAGVFEDDASATSALGGARSARVGYPWAIDSDALGLAEVDPRGVVVVLGLFETEAQAERARPSHPGSRVVRLASREVASERWSRRYLEDRIDGPAPRLVVQIDAHAEPAPAYDGEALSALLSTSQTKVYASFDAFVEEVRLATSELEPICTLAQGTVHTSEDRGERWSYHGLFVPARCEDGREAWVPLERTRVGSVVREAEDGPRQIQLETVECDTPYFREWRYVGGEKAELGEAEPTKLAARGGCGEP